MVSPDRKIAPPPAFDASSCAVQVDVAAEGAVLTTADRRALRELADAVQARYQPVFDENGVQRPWDIEYGFVDDELTLFQIRPLVERGQRLADRVVRALVPAAATEPPAFVFLADVPSGFTE